MGGENAMRDLCIIYSLGQVNCLWLYTCLRVSIKVCYFQIPARCLRFVTALDHRNIINNKKKLLFKFFAALKLML